MQLLCSEKSVAYNAFTVAGIVGGLVKSYCMGDSIPHRVLVDHKTWYMEVRQ